MNTIKTAIRRTIENRLAKIAREEKVRILYACESGSRAWGFASTNSDYDVRFIYVRHKSWYLSLDLEHQPSTIERPIVDELDFSGWDLRKALQLLRKSNPPLLEWLRSPIVYEKNSGFLTGMKRLAARAYSPIRTFHHYHHMAKSNYREYLQKPRVRTKKYFYALRPLLAWQWVLERSGPPPMEFADLLAAAQMPADTRRAVHTLLAQKRTGQELDDGPRIEPLNQFIEKELSRPIPQLPTGCVAITAFNRFFLRYGR